VTLIALGPVAVDQQSSFENRVCGSGRSTSVGILLAAVMGAVVYWVNVQIGRSGVPRPSRADGQAAGTGKPVTARDLPISEIATVSLALEEDTGKAAASRPKSRFRFLMSRSSPPTSKNQMTVVAAMAKQNRRWRGFRPRIRARASSAAVFGSALLHRSECSPMRRRVDSQANCWPASSIP